jgi:hypothetical protein
VTARNSLSYVPSNSRHGRGVVTQNVYAAIILAAALLADDQLSGEAFWRRFSELAAAVDPVCREAKRDADEKHQAYEATWQRVQATAQHRIDQLDPELKAPLRRRSSSSSHRPPPTRPIPTAGASAAWSTAPPVKKRHRRRNVQCTLSSVGSWSSVFSSQSGSYRQHGLVGSVRPARCWVRACLLAG